MVLFVVLPLLLIVLYALQDGSGHFTFANIAKFFTDRDALATFAVSLEVGIETTLICILLGYPAAWILSNRELNKSAVTIALFILPMWINALMRTLATTELFNMLKIPLGKGTLIFGMVYDFLPFMIYPIYNILLKMDKSYAEAAEDLHQGHPAAVYAGCAEWSDDGVHAYDVHLRHLRVPHQQQGEALRYHNPGEHQCLVVELRCRARIHHAVNHRNMLPVRGWFR